MVKCLFARCSKNRVVQTADSEATTGESTLSSGETSIINMEDKVVIVTGSSAGIGAATAILLASKGAKVTLHGRREDKLASVAEECKAASPSGYDPCIVSGDIVNEEVRERLVQATLDAFGHIDGLVNNAGYAAVGGWEKEDLAVMRSMLEVHIVAPYDLSRRCMPQLIETKGAVVNVSSGAGLRGVPSAISYCAGKHGVSGMMKALAAEVAKLGVRINSVNPGMIATELLSRVAEVPGQSEGTSHPDPTTVHPNARVGESIEVAECIAFLLSPAAGMVTGIEMPIDGGLTSAILWK